MSSALAMVIAVGCLSALAAPARGEGESFATWLEGLRAEARERGIRGEILERAFEGVAPIPRVIELDRSQPEFTLTFQQYLDRVVPGARVQKGREKLAENRVLLERVAERFHVQPRFIVALWGIETDFGRLGGSFSVIASLATLAYDGRRSAFFRKELLDALTILDEGHIAVEDMKGSWAGAMGQNQFMPSSFVGYAVDFDGDGRRDIWQTRADVFASAANYLASQGWRDDRTWGRRVQLPEGFDFAAAGPKVRKPLGHWQRLGVRRAEGGDLPTRQLEASLALPEGEGGPAYLVYSNFETILKWNRSTFFAIAVGQLADRISGR